MSYVGVFSVVLLAVLVGFYIRFRARAITEREWALLPAREAYRERFCAFLLRGYRDAAAQVKPPEPADVVRHARSYSDAAGFVAKEGFDKLVNAMVRQMREVMEHCLELVEAWSELYGKLGAADHETLALRRASQMLSERFFEPGLFRPEQVWSTYPSVKVGARHIARRDKLVRQEMMSKGQLETMESPPASTSNELLDKLVASVHEGAAAHVQRDLIRNLDVSDTDLGSEITQWFHKSFGEPRSAAGVLTYEFFTPLRLTDIVADKAYAVRVSAVRAVAARLEQDPDASDNWIAELAWEILGSILPSATRVLEPDFVADVAAAYAYRCNISEKAPRLWADEFLAELEKDRLARKRALEEEAAVAATR